MYGVARHAVAYERHARLVAGPLYRRVARDVGSAGLAAGAIVLDVGTGPGSVPRLVAAAQPELTVEGVDLSAEMITIATDAASRSATWPPCPIPTSPSISWSPR